MTSGNISLDTSVLVRLLVGVPSDQAKIAAAFVAEQVAAKKTLTVSNLVLSEAYFALQKFYNISKSETLEMIAGISNGSGLTLTQATCEVLKQQNLASSKPGFVDRMIHGESVELGDTLVTFEKAGKKLPGTVVLGGK